MKIGLKLKVSLQLALLLATVLILLSWIVLTGIRDDQIERMESLLARQGDAAALRVQQEYLTGERLPIDSFLKQRGQRLALDLGALSLSGVTLYDANGAFVATSLPIQPYTDVQDALTYAERGQSSYITIGDRVLYIAPLYALEQRIGAVQIHYSMAEQLAFNNRLRLIFWQAGIAVLVSSFLLGYFYVRRQVGAIERLNRAVHQIEQGYYLSEPILHRKDELGELAQGIYQMSSGIKTAVSALTNEQRELLNTVDRLSKLEKQQKQFIGNISHELKTPLTAILAYADLLQLYRDDPELLLEAKQQIGNEAERLYELVEKTLQLSASEVYDFEVNRQPVQLRQLIEECMERLRRKATNMKVELFADLQDIKVWGDPDLLRHVMLNMIDNAIKYNRQGGIVTITSKLEEHRDQVEIRFSDTGIGIPESLKARIFEPFFTVSDDRSRARGGSGLGLSLVRSFLEKQDASIRLDETSTEGSVFIITLQRHNVYNLDTTSR